MKLDANPRVVYLMGAGASAQTLPMVKQIPKALEEHSRWVDSIPSHISLPPELIPGNPKALSFKVVEEYKETIRALKEGAAAHESIDTYAKKLYLRSAASETDRKRLDDLKLGLSLFMACIQAQKGVADRRYDGFLASLLTRTPTGIFTLPKEVLVLNWNYDQQMALAYGEYREKAPLHECIKSLGIYPLELIEKRNGQHCRVVHLNGMFAYQTERGVAPVLEFTSELAEAQLLTILSAYAQVKYGSIGHGKMLLRFAWENQEEVTQGLNTVLNTLDPCEVLVVIGYSFPFFNREIDRAIVKHMPNLKRVYVQSHPDTVEDVARTVRTMVLPDGCKVETYGNTDKFLLPPEL